MVNTQILTLIAIFLILAGVFPSCTGKTEEPEENEIVYYYYFGEKIFLEKVKDKIFIVFTPDISKEQFHVLTSMDASLQTISSFTSWKENVASNAALETKNGKQIPSATIEVFKSRPEVVSVTYMYQYNEALLGLANIFVVKLKETASYAQLQELAEQH